MRTIERSSAFQRDYKRTKATPRYRKELGSLLSDVVSLLLTDDVLPAIYRDHALAGDWAGYRECHLKPDLLVIYRKPDANTLRLARLGSHSELFG
jgi:mRNA interferase YafQ